MTMSTDITDTAEEKPPADSGRNFLTEGFVIGLVTLLSYVSAYLFERGYASFFDISL